MSTALSMYQLVIARHSIPHIHTYVQLTNSLCTMKEQCRKLQVDSKFLHCHGKELEDRLKISEDMILALRGRASSSKKMEERLRDKCSSLERALDTASVQARAAVRVPVQEKTRVELELLKECKKKVCVYVEQGGHSYVM